MNMDLLAKVSGKPGSREPDRLVRCEICKAQPGEECRNSITGDPLRSLKDLSGSTCQRGVGRTVHYTRSAWSHFKCDQADVSDPSGMIR